jgi:hypothetical protein
VRGRPLPTLHARRIHRHPIPCPTSTTPLPPRCVCFTRLGYTEEAVEAGKKATCSTCFANTFTVDGTGKDITCGARAAASHRAGEVGRLDLAGIYRAACISAGRAGSPPRWHSSYCPPPPPSPH